MARGAWRIALGAVLHRLRRRVAEALLRLFPERRENGWDSSRGCCLMSAILARSSCSVQENEWPLARTQWTRFYLDPKTSAFRPMQYPSSAASVDYDAPGEWRDLLDARRSSSRPRSPDRRRSSFCCHPRRATRTCSSCCACSTRRQGSAVPGRARPARRRWRRAGCALASQARSRARCRTGRVTRTTSCSRSTPGKAVRARHRDLADLYRRAQGYRIALTVRGKDYVDPGEAPPFRT